MNYLAALISNLSYNMMKNTITHALLYASISALSLTACKNEDKKTDTETKDSVTTNPTITTEEQKSPAAAEPASFDINTIPESTATLGSFPFVEAPAHYAFNKPNTYREGFQEKTFDREYFYNKGVYIAKEGKTFKAQLRIAEKNDHEFSKLVLLKNFEEVLKGLGAVKLNSGQSVTSEAKKKNKEEAPNAYTDGYLFSSNNWDDVHSWVLRKADSEIWFQLNLGSSLGYLAVLETQVP